MCELTALCSSVHAPPPWRHGRTTCVGTAPSWWTSSMVSSSPRWSVRHADTSVLASTPSTSCLCPCPWTAQCIWRSLVRQTEEKFSSQSTFLSNKTSLVCVVFVVIKLDGSTPVRYGLRLNMDEKYTGLKKQLSELCSLKPEQILLAEVHTSNIKVLTPWARDS